MAKFVDTTWAACFARQKPVSTSAKPACMNITSAGPDDDPQQVDLLTEHHDGVGLLCECKWWNERRSGDADTDRGKNSTCTLWALVSSRSDLMFTNPAAWRLPDCAAT